MGFGSFFQSRRAQEQSRKKAVEKKQKAEEAKQAKMQQRAQSVAAANKKAATVAVPDEVVKGNGNGKRSDADIAKDVKRTVDDAIRCVDFTDNGGGMRKVHAGRSAVEKPELTTKTNTKDAVRDASNRDISDNRPSSVSAPSKPASRLSAPKKQKDPSDLSNRPEYSSEVQLRVVNLTLDPISSMTKFLEEVGIHPDEAHLLSLTRVNSSKEAMHWANQVTKEAAFEIYVNKRPCRYPLSQIRRMAFLLARRSIPGACGAGFTAAVNIAMEQNITQSEEAGEQSAW